MSTASESTPRVGVAVIVHRGRTVLLGRRVGASHGAGHWQFPGGHLETFETIEQCAAREVREETGLEIGRVLHGPYTNDVFESERRHYVTLFVVAASTAGDPVVREPDKCAEWRWFEWDALPSPLFLPIRHLLAQGWQPPFL